MEYKKMIKRKKLKVSVFLILLFLGISMNAGIKKAEDGPSAAVLQQNNSAKVKGIVTDEKGEPLIGVSILDVNNSNNITTTDLNGKFEIRIKDTTSKLKFIYVGYDELTISIEKGHNLNNLRVALKSNQKELDEVVVVGYGTQKKSTLTGAVSQISGEDIKKEASVNITNTLAGKTAGVISNIRSSEPGADDATILIRGVGTTGDNSPLIVVDGIAGRDFSRLNPDDIESISVLKDASAGIYGARAANGVILITTKHGKEGKVQSSYSGSMSWEQPTRVPKMLNAYEYATYANEYDRGHGLPDTYSADVIDMIKSGKDQINYPNTDWWSAVAKDWAPRTSHSLSVSGGTDKLNFYSSIQYLWQDAIYKKSAQNYSQYQFTTNLQAQLSKRVKLGIDILGRDEVKERGVFATDYLFGFLLTTNPISAPYYPNGLPRVGYEYASTNAAMMVTNLPGHTLENYYTMNLKPTLHADLDFITKGLYFETYAALDYNFDVWKQLNKPYDVYNYNASTGTYDNQKAATGAISLGSASSNSDRTTLHARIGYTQTFNQDHKVDAFVAYEQEKYNYNYLYAYRTNFLSDAIPEIFAGSSNPADWGNDGYSSIDARQNYFGRVNYSYKAKYLAEVTLRYDGSINFSPAKRWGLFPAVSGGWILSEEKFFQQIKPVVSFFKVKGSWGAMGNDRISAFQYLSRYLFTTGALFGDQVVKGLYESVKANQNATWEKANTTDVGFNSQFLDNKFSFNFDYFFSKRSDILAYRNASIPTYTGITSLLPAENIGKTQNQGIELEAGYNLKGKEYSFSVNGNFTYTKDKIIFVDEAASTPLWQRATGHPIYGYTLYKAIGIYKTQAQIDNSPHIDGAQVGDLIYQDMNGDKKITWDDAVRVNETPTPKMMFGLTLSGSYKGIDLTVFFQGQADAKLLVQPTMNMLEDFYNGRYISTNTAEQNANAKWPRAFVNPSGYGDAFNGVPSTWWLRDASFVRLKSMELGYTLPKSVINKLKITTLRLYVNGSNLFTLDHIKVFDPEINHNAAGAQSNGITAYPISRVLTTGLNITF